MEVMFWKHKIMFVTSIFIASLLFVTSLILVILSLNNLVFWGCSIVFLIFFIILMCLIFLDKNVLSKLTLSEDGIKWTRFNKEIMYMNWDEIVEIKQTPAGRATCYLTFDTGQKFMHIDVSSKKMYDAIINICPSGNIKYRIRNLDFLKWYQRK